MGHFAYWLAIVLTVGAVGAVIGMVVSPLWLAAALSFVFGMAAGQVGVAFDPFLD
jgi:heme/copper-type cytochrome/quinol oxidase subunit 4